MKLPCWWHWGKKLWGWFYGNACSCDCLDQSDGLTNQCCHHDNLTLWCRVAVLSLAPTGLLNALTLGIGFMCASCCLCDVWSTIWTDVILLLHSGPVSIKSGTVPEYKKAWEMGEKGDVRLNNRTGVCVCVCVCVCACVCVCVCVCVCSNVWLSAEPG